MGRLIVFAVLAPILGTNADSANLLVCLYTQTPTKPPQVLCAECASIEAYRKSGKRVCLYRGTLKALKLKLIASVAAEQKDSLPL
jgi:hypothetical protein